MSVTMCQEDFFDANGILHHVEIQDNSIERGDYTDVVLRVLHDWGEMANGEVCSACCGIASWEFHDFGSAYDRYLHLLREHGATPSRRSASTREATAMISLPDEDRGLPIEVYGYVHLMPADDVDEVSWFPLVDMRPGDVRGADDVGAAWVEQNPFSLKPASMGYPSGAAVFRRASYRCGGIQVGEHVVGEVVDQVREAVAAAREERAVSRRAPHRLAWHLGWRGPGRYLFREEGAGDALSKRDCPDERSFCDAFSDAALAAGGARIDVVKTRRRGPSPSFAEQLPEAAATWSPRNASRPDEVSAWCDDPVWLVCAKCGEEWRTTPRAVSRRPETQSICTRCRKAANAANASRRSGIVCTDNGMRFASVSDAARWLASVLPGGLSPGYLRVLISKSYKDSKPVKGFTFVEVEDGGDPE